MSPQRGHATPSGQRIFRSASRHLSSSPYFSISDTRLISAGMAQKPKKKDKLPKNITERPDHEIMERLFGKRVMKKVDALVEERSEDPQPKEK